MNEQAPPRPLVFIDVDGVLNRLVHRAPNVPDHLARRRVYNAGSGRTFTLFMDRADKDRLLSLTDVADLAWGTTWEHEANQRIGSWLGLPRLPVATREHRERSKALGIRRLAGDRPFAWLDDDLWAADRGFLSEHPAPALAVEVDPVAGLADEHIEAVRAWVVAMRSTARP